MPTKKSMSVAHDTPAGHAHNIEEEYRKQLPNIDPTRTHLNVVLEDTSLEELYAQEFNAALSAYNQKQAEKGHPERAISDYLAKITDSKQEKPAYEMVVQIGNKDTNPATDKYCRALAVKIYQDFLREFHAKFPALKVFQAVIHLDEATPHLHIAYVPVSTGNKRGLETKNSLRGAIREMGYGGDIRDVNKDLFKVLEDVSRKHGIERLDLGIKRARVSARDYKQMANDIEQEDYPYQNDPRLMELVTEQQVAIEQLSGLLDEQEATVEALANDIEQAGIFDLKGLKEAATEAKEASAAIEERRKGIHGFVAKARECIQQVPQFWRDYIINPVADKLRREAYSQDKPQSLADRASQSRDLFSSARSVSHEKKRDDIAR